MAARRVLIVLLILFGGMLVATALAPRTEDPKSSETTTTETAPEPVVEDPDPPEQLSVDAQGAGVDDIPLELGDTVELAVKSDVAGTVEIDGLGLIEPVDPNAPAVFNLLLDQAGTFKVYLLGEKQPIAKLEVRPAAPPEPG